MNEQELQYINTMGTSNNELNNFYNKLSNINTSLNSLNEIQKNGLSEQNNVKSIINYEANRLQQKKQTIDDAIISQNRIIYYNDNSRKIYAAYLRILIVITIILAIIWVVTTIKNIITFIPSIIFDIILVLTICIGVIIIYNYYIDIIRRKRYNFDELNNAPPTTNSDSNSDSNITNGDIMHGLVNICIGQECCNPKPSGANDDNKYTKWDETTSKCVKDTDTFTIMNNETKPKEEYEYAYYSPYK